MKINKAVITAAGPKQRNLPLQTLIDRDGEEKAVLRIIVEEVLRAGVDEICVVVRPGDAEAYASVAGDHAGRLHFAYQTEPRGYGHAVYCAKDFVGADGFLHLVGDHLYVSRSAQGCAEHLVAVAEAEACAVSAVQPTRESLLLHFGTIGGQRLAGQPELYRVESVVEKPTPTKAERHLVVPGMRAGHYLCFFGMHVLTPTIFDILGEQLGDPLADPLGRSDRADQEPRRVSLSDALAELARREKYLALEKQDWRYDVGVKYGLLNAQLALALSGQDRDEVLTHLLELLAHRELSTRELSSRELA